MSTNKIKNAAKKFLSKKTEEVSFLDKETGATIEIKPTEIELQRIVILAKINNALVGEAYIINKDKEVFSKDGYYLEVKEAFRKKGIGTLLLDVLDEIENPLERVWTSNKEQFIFYLKRGYAPYQKYTGEGYMYEDPTEYKKINSDEFKILAKKIAKNNFPKKPLILQKDKVGSEEFLELFKNS